MTKKPFSRNMYDLADNSAKKQMISWIEENHPNCSVDSDENYFFDISVTPDDGGLPFFYEVEVKYGWKAEWPDDWDELRIPHRKQRLLDKWKKEHPDSLLTFVVFNKDCTKAWHVDGNVVAESEVKEASNRYVRKGEMFFHIPVDQAYVVDMTNDNSNS